jgi:hypothetical protein
MIAGPIRRMGTSEDGWRESSRSPVSASFGERLSMKVTTTRFQVRKVGYSFGWTGITRLHDVEMRSTS